MYHSICVVLLGGTQENMDLYRSISFNFNPFTSPLIIKVTRKKLKTPKKIWEEQEARTETKEIKSLSMLQSLNFTTY